LQPLHGPRALELETKFANDLRTQRRVVLLQAIWRTAVQQRADKLSEKKEFFLELKMILARLNCISN
jgi:hypothetical protein